MGSPQNDNLLQELIVLPDSLSDSLLHQEEEMPDTDMPRHSWGCTQGQHDGISSRALHRLTAGNNNIKGWMQGLWIGAPSVLHNACFGSCQIGRVF
jgi:hypothetical protein